MALADAIQGATYTGQQITWTKKDGSAQNLSGATLSGKIKAVDKTVTSITGLLAISDAVNGVFDWTYSAADVAASGDFTVQFKATYGGSGYDLTYEARWTVKSQLT